MFETAWPSLAFRIDDDTDDDYGELLARAAAATDATGLSDGTDRPATTIDELEAPR